MNPENILAVKDYEFCFGSSPSDARLQHITDHFIGAYNRRSMTACQIKDRIPMDWFELLIDYNERTGQCANFITLIDIRNSPKMKNVYGGYGDNDTINSPKLKKVYGGYGDLS